MLNNLNINTFEKSIKGMFEISREQQSCHNCKFLSEAATVLDEKEVGILSSGMVDVMLKKGDKLFTEGLPHSHVIYIRQGFVKVHMTGPSGRDQILKFARPGAYVGIQCLLGGNINKFSATALNQVRACFIDGETFKKLLFTNALFSSKILTKLCEEELVYFSRFVNLQQKNNSGRLADAILYFADKVFKKDKFTLPFPFVDLAALSGTTRESITRSLKDFVNGGIIVQDKRKINILNKDILKKISENG